MKKTCFITLMVLFISCVLFVSCNPDVTPVAPVDPEGTINRSLEKLEAGGKIELENVGEDTEINLSGFTLEDGVYIELVNSKGKAIKSTKGVNEEFIFVREDGSLIPIPDENGNIKMKGKDLGVGNGTKVIVNKLLNLNEDYQITKKEYEGTGKQVAEEYYYCNLRDEKIKANEVVIVITGFGAQNVRLLQRGALNWDIKGVLNLSSYKQSGFAVNMYLSFDEGAEDQKLVLHILNPITVKSTAQTLDKALNVIKVDKQKSSKKIVVEFNDITTELFKKIAFSELALVTKPRYLDGKQRAVDVVPEFDVENKSITYHLGEVDEAFIFNLDWEDTGYVPGSASIYLTDDDWNDFNDISNTDTAVSISSKIGKIVTWAFKSDNFYNILVTNNLSIDKSMIHYTGDIDGSGLGYLKEFFFNTDHYGEVETNGQKFTGYVLLDCTEENSEEIIVSLINAEQMTIDCPEVEYYQDGVYRCTDPSCSKEYTGEFIQACSKNIFAGLYVDYNYNEFGVFKNISHDVNGLKIGSISSNDSHGDVGGASDGRRKEKILLNDGTERWIEFRLQKISKKDNDDMKLVYDVYWYGNQDTPTSVTFTKHNWQLFSEDPCVMECSFCHSHRSATMLELSSAERQGYDVKFNNLPVALYIPIPGAEEYYEYHYESEASFEALPEDEQIYTVPVFVFSPAAGHSIIIEGTDNSGNNKPSVYTISFDTNQ